MGTKRTTTLKDIARVTGFSTATVSRALNDSPLISERTRCCIQKAAHELGYSKNAVASGLSRGNLSAIGLIVSDITNPFYAEVARGVEDAAQRHGYGVILCNADENAAKEASYARFLWTHRVGGVILASSRLNDPVVRQLQQRCPLVLLSRIPYDTAVNFVVSDDLGGGRLATEHLIRQGHRRIAFVGGPVEVAPSWLRYQGYLQALKAHELPLRKPWVRFGEFTLESGKRLTQALLRQKRRPTAIFAANDLLALGAWAAAQAAGLAVPQDLAVVGYDNIPLGALPQIELTTVAQPLRRMGQLAAEVLFRAIERPQAPPVQRVLPPKLVIRRSCGAVRGAVDKETPGG